jgi:hypothetical protein
MSLWTADLSNVGYYLAYIKKVPVLNYLVTYLTPAATYTH